MPERMTAQAQWQVWGVQQWQALVYTCGEGSYNGNTTSVSLTCASNMPCGARYRGSQPLLKPHVAL